MLIATGLAVAGALVGAGASVARAPTVAPDPTRVELAPEWRWERKAVRFDGMFRRGAGQGQREALDWIRSDESR